jgi:hypothetical protein
MAPSSPSTTAEAASAIRTQRSHGHRRPGLRIRQQWSIILLFGMAILLAFYTILTAPTVEQELVQRRRRGIYSYGSSSGNGSGMGSQQREQEQEQVTTPTATMATATTAATIVTANVDVDWQSVHEDGRPFFRMISSYDRPVVMLSPLPLPVQTVASDSDSSNNHPNWDISLTNTTEDENATDTDTNSTTGPTTNLTLLESDDDEADTTTRQGSRTLTVADTSTQRQQQQQAPVFVSKMAMQIYYGYYAALLSAVLVGVLVAKRSLDKWIAWEADRQEDDLAYDIAYTSTTSEIGYGTGNRSGYGNRNSCHGSGYGSFVHSEWTGDSFDKFDL